jgi:hypothetical protein
MNAWNELKKQAVDAPNTRNPIASLPNAIEQSTPTLDIPQIRVLANRTLRALR